MDNKGPTDPPLEACVQSYACRRTSVFAVFSVWKILTPDLSFAGSYHLSLSPTVVSPPHAGYHHTTI